MVKAHSALGNLTPREYAVLAEVGDWPAKLLVRRYCIDG